MLESAFRKEHKSPAGRNSIDVLIMFKMLVLQKLFNLSDEELEFQVNDRRSFELSKSTFAELRTFLLQSIWQKMFQVFWKC